MRLAAALVALALAALAAPTPPELVESVYATHFYPAIQHVLTALSNRVPLALLDVVIAGAAGWWLAGVAAAVARGLRHGWLPATARLAVQVAAVASAAYLIFLFTWGLNYRRPPLKDRLDFNSSRVSAAALLSFARASVDQVNRLHAVAQSSGWAAPDAFDEGLARAFVRAQRDVGAPTLATPARPKRTILDAYFIRAAVAGMTDPYFLETLVASDLLPFERPFVVAHEWGHLAGRADEGEANFLGWLTCLRGSAAHQYSGWLFVYDEAVDALETSARGPVMAALDPGPRADLEAIRARLARHVSPIVHQAGWRTYDRYLKANRVAEGAASYGDVLNLILGTRFADGWQPTLR